FDFSCLESNVEKVATQLTGKWIWPEADAASKAPVGVVYFHKQIKLDGAPSEALAVVTCDNSFTLYVNGKNVATGKDFTKPQLVNLKSHLKQGENLLAVKAINHLPDNTVPAEDKTIPDSASNPAGLYLSARLKVKGKTTTFGTDKSWSWSRKKTSGWETNTFGGEGWLAVAELGDAKADPWNAQPALAGALASTSFRGNVRAALVNADPLMVSLGRPSREQVITTRSSAATTLQALELTNGETLAKILEQGAAKLIADKSKSANDLVNSL